MDPQNNSGTVTVSSIGGLEDADNDNASVDSDQLMADIDEFISGSTEVEEEEADCDYESENNLSGSDPLKMSTDLPTSNAKSLSSQAVISCAQSNYQNIQLNQPVVLLTRLSDHDIATCLAGSALSKVEVEGGNSQIDSKKCVVSSEVKNDVWVDDADGSLSELSVSDFSLSDNEDDSISTKLISPPAETKSIDKKVAKNDTDRVDKRRNSKETPSSSLGHVAKNTSQQSHQSKSKPESTQQSKFSGASSTKPTIKSKDKSQMAAVTKSSASRVESSKSLKRTSSSGASTKTMAKSSHSDQKISKPVSNVKQARHMTEQKENVKGEEHSKQPETDDIDQNWRYEMNLTGFDIVELTNESFRKFINFASDCAMYFLPPATSNKPSEGAVSLYFGDFAGIQLAMQKLGQVMFTSTNKLQGQITGRFISPSSSGRASAISDGKWKIVNHVKLCFTLYTAWTEKLKQVVQMKDWKKADGNHEKFAKIQRVPTPITKQCLSLLFPFSINIHSPSYKNDVGKTNSSERFHPAEVKYASQELMETVLGCFQNMSVTMPSALVPPTKLYIINVKPKISPPGHKYNQQSNLIKPSQCEYFKQGRLFPSSQPQKQHHRHHQQHPHHNQHHQHQRSGSGPGSHGTDKLSSAAQQRSHPPKSSASDQTKDRKRPSNAVVERTLPTGKKSRFSQPDEKSTHPSASIIGSASNASGDKNETQDMGREDTAGDIDDLRVMAQAQGLDPNNSDVICILQMQKQLQSMQSLMTLPQTEPESTSKPSTKSNSGKSVVEMEIAEAEQKLRDTIALRQKQLLDLEEKLKASKMKTQQSKQESTILEAQGDYGTSGASKTLPPNQNDQPLDFKKPQPKVELAVKADEMRSKMTEVVKDTRPSFKKPLPVSPRQAPLRSEDCALPLEFGKNVMKVNPKVIQRQSANVIVDSAKNQTIRDKPGILKQNSRGGNRDNRLESMEMPRKRTRVSRWSSDDDGESNRRDVRGSKGVGIGIHPTVSITNQKDWGVNNNQALGDGLLPTPTGSLDIVKGGKEPQSTRTNRNQKVRNFTEERRDSMGKNVDLRGLKGRANTRWEPREVEGNYIDNETDIKYNEPPYTSNTNPHGSDLKRYNRAGRSGSAGCGDGTNSYTSQFSLAGDKGLSIIGKLQEEAFGGERIGDSYRSGPNPGRGRLEEHYGRAGAAKGSQSHDKGFSIIEKLREEAFGGERRGDSQIKDRTGRSEEQYGSSDQVEYYQEETGWTDDGYDEHYGWDNQGETNLPSAGRTQSQKGNQSNRYSTTQGVQRSDYTSGGFESGNWNEGDDYYRDSVEFSLDSSNTDTGRGREDWNFIDYDESGRRQNVRNPVTAKRQKLDENSSEGGSSGQRMRDEWSQQKSEGSISRRGYFHGGGRGRGRDASYGLNKGDTESSCDLYDIEKEQKNVFGEGDEYVDGNYREFGSGPSSYGRGGGGLVRGRGGSIPSRGRGHEMSRGAGRGEGNRGRGARELKRGGGFVDAGKGANQSGAEDNYGLNVKIGGSADRGRGANRGRGVDFGVDYYGGDHDYEDDYDYEDGFASSGRGGSDNFDDGEGLISSGYGRPSNAEAGYGKNQSLSQERREYGEMTGDRWQVGNNERDVGGSSSSLVGSERGRGSGRGHGSSFGSSERGRGGRGGASFSGSERGDNGRGRGSSFGSSERGRGGRGGASFSGSERGDNGRGRGSSFVTSDRGRDGSGGGSFSGSERGRGGGVDHNFMSRVGSGGGRGFNNERGGGSFGNSVRGRISDNPGINKRGLGGNNFGSGDRSYGGSGSFGPGDSDTNKGRGSGIGRGKSNDSRGNMQSVLANERPGLLGSGPPPQSGGYRGGSGEGKGVPPPPTRSGVNFY